MLYAVECVGLGVDENLSWTKCANYEYYPGWCEGSATLALFINQKAFDALPANYKAILKNAAAEANQWSTAKYDVTNPAALRRLISNGAQLKRFSPDILQACYKANQQFMSEMIDASPAFKKIHGPWSKFRDQNVLWSQFCEMQFEILKETGTKR